MTTVSRDQLVQMQIGIDVADLPQLSRLLAKVSKLPNVVSARRRK